jgi:acetyl esterase/lipase
MDTTMRKLTLAALLVLWVSAADAAEARRTMRVDYYHTGNSTQEMFALDEVVIEPLPWPGNPNRPIDDLNLGAYLFEVTDRASKKLLYSRGFASVYGEWVTTGEARKMNRTFHESLRFPAPDAPVQIVLKKRDAQNNWREAWTLTVDPRDKFIDTSVPQSPGPVIEIEKNGPSEAKVDLLILGDGYTAGERKKFEADARRMVDRLFATTPFKERRRDFNVWGLCPAAHASGVSRPSTGIHRASPLRTTYDAFDLERYVLTYDNKAFRRIASFAPYEFVEILVNERTYGGGGIFGLYSTVGVDNEWAAYVFVHEFGHHIAGLADEYYASPVAYLPATTRVEPWEPNATALHDPARLKWKDLVQNGTPLPTPWGKESYENKIKEYQQRRVQLRKEGRPEAEMEKLMHEHKKLEDGLLAEEKYAGKVGAFEGANYESKGFYRPEVNCIMFTRCETFCTVCRRAIERVIDQYSAGKPAAQPEGAKPMVQKKTYTYKTVGQTRIEADVYRPDDGQVRPVLVWLHGGALIMGSRVAPPQRLQDLCRSEGYVLVSFDYRLAPEVKLPAIIEDLEDAFAWLRGQGRELLRIDQDRMVVAGGSAGGYLTLTSGFRVKPRPTALVAYWGYGDVDGPWYTQPSDFYRKMPLVAKEEAYQAVHGDVLTGSGGDIGKNRGRFYLYLRQNGLWTREVTGFEPGKDQAKLDSYCPARNVTADYPPTLLIHGTVDTDVPYELSSAMAKELARHQVPHELVTVPGAGHGLAGGDKKLIDEANAKADAFIKKHLKSEK